MNLKRSQIVLLVADIVACSALQPSTARAQQATPSPKSPAEAPQVRVAPYGIVFFNLFSNDGGTNNGDVPLWAVSGAGNTGAVL